MTTNDLIIKTVPVLKVNNRRLNLEFYCRTLGMKNLLEEGAIVSLGDQTKSEKLVIEESPSMRTRKVEGPKKIAQITLKVSDPKEIEALLHQAPQIHQIYKGKKGYAFTAISPEGDLFFVHAEDDVATLEAISDLPVFELQEHFVGLTQFHVEEILLHVPNKAKAEAYYQAIGLTLPLAFKEEIGPDLLVNNDVTWDLSMLKFSVESFDVDELSGLFEGRDLFIPKSKKFLLTTDDSRIELWFEKA